MTRTRCFIRTATCLAFAGLSAGFGNAQQPTWTLVQPTTSPIARSHHAMVYDSVRERTVLFGGLPGFFRLPLADTWEWDGTNWLERTPATSPPARSGHAMAFDSTRGRTVLFGGYPHADTWEWDGINWIQHTPTTSPPALIGHGMAYDSARNRTLLYGATFVPGAVRSTWEWDGSNWSELSPVTIPAVTYEFALAYDSVRSRTVLFGGWDRAASSQADSTWEWDGTNWTESNPTTAPPASQGHSMVFDAAGQRTILFGGIPGVAAETWEWSGTDWVLANPATAPPMRDHTAMAYDSRRGETVLFGGYSPSSDTWIYKRGAVTASFTAIGTGCGSPVALLATSAGSRPVLGNSFSLVSSNLPNAATAGFMTIGITRITPYSLTPIGMNGCFLYHSYDAVLYFPVANGAGIFTTRVPGLPGLLGQKLFFQSAAGLVATNGGEALFGNQ